MGNLKPEIGMGVTKLLWADRHPYTIVEIVSDKKIVVQMDDAKVVKGEEYNGSAEYEYTTNPKSPLTFLRLNKFDKWKEIGQPNGSTFVIGSRRKYYDPSF